MSRVQEDINEVINKEELFLSLKDLTVFVTGATGFIGSILLKVLLAADAKYDLNVKLIGQIRNYEKAKDIFGDLFKNITFVENYDVDCDYIIHTVSPTTSRFFIENPVETIKISVGSTGSVLETAKKCNANMIYLSSMEQYGVPYESGDIMSEDKIGIIDHLNVRSSYSESKRLCECLCASYASEYGVNVKIARLAQTFGAGIPSGDNRMPMQFAKAVVFNKDIVLHTAGKSVSNCIYSTDAVSAIFMLINKGEAGSAYNISNDSEIKTVKEIADIVANDVAQGKIEVKIEIPEENMGYAPDNTMKLSSAKLRSLGWNAEVGIAEAYKRLSDHIMENC